MPGKVGDTVNSVSAAVLRLLEDEKLKASFVAGLRRDCLEEYLHCSHREFKTLSEPYLPIRRYISPKIGEYLGAVPQEDKISTVYAAILERYMAYHEELIESESAVQNWLDSDGMEETRQLLEENASLLSDRFEFRLRAWHKDVKNLADSRGELDEKIWTAKKYYLRAVRAAACMHAISQDPKLLDRSGFALKGEFRFSRKYAKRELGVPDNAPFVKASAYLNAHILTLAHSARANDATKSLLMPATSINRKSFMEGTRLLPLEKLSEEAFPIADLFPERVRNRGGVFSGFLDMFLLGSEGKVPDIALINRAIPGIHEEISAGGDRLFGDAVIYTELYPLLMEAVMAHSMEDAEELKIRGASLPYNAVAANLKRSDSKCNYLHKKYISGSTETITLYRLMADNDIVEALEPLLDGSTRVLPYASDKPGISIEKLECTLKEAEKLCTASQCLSRSHMQSLAAIPLRDVALQGIHTSFSIDELEAAFCWGSRDELSKSVMGSLWDVAFHMGDEGALVFPYAHRSNSPCMYSAYMEERQKGLPICNVRKPFGADMSTGKYKKSTRPESAPDGKYLPNLPYFTLDSITPEFKQMSLWMLACDYARARMLPSGRAEEFFQALSDYCGQSEASCDLDDPHMAAYLIEGEKKALALKALNDAKYVQALDEYLRTGKLPINNGGFHVAVGVGGVWFSKSKANELNDDLRNSVPFAGRTAGIVFDKDTSEKPQVLRAFLRGANSLKSAGAKNVVCSMMAGPNQADPKAKGLDDEISALLSEDWNNLTYREHICNQFRAYGKYLPFFERSMLPARDDVTCQKEKKFLEAVKSYGQKAAMKDGSDSELGLMYSGDGVRRVYMRAMTQNGALDEFLRSESKITRKVPSCGHSR